jgi:hypothetical protein
MSLEISPGTLMLGGGIIVALGLVQTAWAYRQNSQSSGYTPGLKTIVSTIRPITFVLPPVKLPFGKDWYLSLGINWWPRTRYECEPSLTSPSFPV